MILVFGNINYDLYFPLRGLPGPHEKIECPEAAAGFGGSAANTAWWLSRMGIPVALAGAVGRDLFGEEHVRALERSGVLVSGVDRFEESSGLAVVFSLEREKRMIRIPGANACGRFHPELLEKCRLVYLSGVHGPARAAYAREARSRGIPVVCGWHGSEDGELASAVSGFILNADEGKRLTGLDDPTESIRALDVPFAAITLPGGGCVVSRGIEVWEVSALELSPVDRTGGGDAFASAFLAGYYRGLSLPECGALGLGLSRRR